MADFVVIDFETANEMRGSPCAVGYCVVNDLEVADSGSFLIRLPEFRFDEFNVSLHGITAEMCKSAPEWPEALGRLRSIIDGSLVVAHYAPTIATCDRCRDYETNRVVFGCVALGLYDGINGSHTVWQ